MKRLLLFHLLALAILGSFTQACVNVSEVGVIRVRVMVRVGFRVRINISVRG